MLARVFDVIVGIAVPLAAFVSGARSTDPLWLWKHPRLLGRELLVIVVIVPVAAAVLVEVLSPRDVVVRAGVVVAICAIGMGAPDLLKRTAAPEAIARHVIALDLTLLGLAVIYMPLAVAIHGAIFAHEIALPWYSVAQVVLVQMLVPFVVGVACARWLPRVVAPIQRWGPPILEATMVLVGVAALAATWRALLDLEPVAWLTCAAVAVMAVAIGHALGGPARETRAVLAGFSAIRFPALAMLLAAVIPRGARLLPTIIAYTITSAVVVVVYRVVVRRRVGKRGGTGERGAAIDPVGRGV